MPKYQFAAAIAALALSASVVTAQDATTYPFDGDFEDATFAVENEIIGAGLVIDYVAHTGAMLARTGADVGSETALFDGADIFLFCSATLSRKVMEVDPANIAYCPYGIFVTDQGGDVEIGYRNFPEGEMQEIQGLLDTIARAAVGQ